MAEFLTNLFNSIFTPGPTPTLLVATNVSFACLQLVLFLLLIGTYSIHFVVLSGLCAGLWWSINWFVAELRVEAEKERVRKEKEGTTGTGGQGDRREVDGSDTEGEGEGEANVVEVGGSGAVSGSKEIEVVEAKGEVKDRRALLGGGGDASRSEASTEDEWERVDETEKDK